MMVEVEKDDSLYEEQIEQAKKILKNAIHNFLEAGITLLILCGIYEFLTGKLYLLTGEIADMFGICNAIFCVTFAYMQIRMLIDGLYKGEKKWVFLLILSILCGANGVNDFIYWYF